MTWSLMLVSLIASTVTQDADWPLDEIEFRRLHQELNPRDELWKTIPWRISLLDAQRQAAKQEKLIFIWAMDGHPLGCT